MLTKIRKRLMNSLTTGETRPQATQSLNDFVHPVVLIAQHHPQRLHAFLVRGRAFPLGGAKRIPEMRRGMREIEHLFTKRQRLAKIAPVVWRPIGHFDDP